MNFELRTEIMHMWDKTFLGIFMNVNNRKFNCLSLLDGFKDKESAWASLEPALKELLNHCYAEDDKQTLTYKV